MTINLYEIEEALVYGFNLCSQTVFDFYREEVRSFENIWIIDNEGCYITKERLTYILSNRYNPYELVFINDFNCKKSEAIALFEMIISANKKFVFTTERFDLIDLMLECVHRANLTNFIVISEGKIIPFDLAFSLRKNRGLEWDLT